MTIKNDTRAPASAPVSRAFALRALCAAALALTPAGLARAQWSNDPNINFAIADHTGDQVIPLVGATSDGGSYVAWFDGTPSGFQVYLQHLTPAGVEIFPHNGILISSHPQNSAL